MISRLGRFEIQAEIGRGGFGQVFYALDPLMNRAVAIKVLTATEDVGSLNRFKNEATAAGNLRHENIITVYEFGQSGEVPFLVMEYLNGEDLLSVIRNQTPLSLYQKVRIMDQVADGLHCAHQNGVLHRDVKPANIMLLKDGGVKIMDFGIARLVRDTSTRLTQHGYLIGTVVYMAPELFTNENTEVDALCDIWSYGVVMYELLSGKNPFQTGSLQSEMYKIVNHNPAPLPREICPADLQAVIGKLLTRDRQSRYSSLEETRFDLQPILLNLKKGEADRLVSLAQQLMFQERPAEALEHVREARKMDPRNGTARIIFERIQDQLRKQSVVPQIDELVLRGNEAAEQRRFPEAISHLEAAQRLDPSNEKILVRLQELRNLKAKREEAASLINEAGQGFRVGRLTDAFEHASNAVLLDPDNHEGRLLLESIENAIHAREAEAALDSEISRARGLMAVGNLDTAMATLKALELHYPGRSAAQDLMAEIADRMAERDRLQEFSKRLNQAKAAVLDAQFGEAIKELEQLLQANPRDREVADLLAYAKQESASKARSEELKRITDAALEFNRTQDFSDAIQILETGLKRYPDDLSLTRLLRSTYIELQNCARERALRDGLQRCEEFRRSGKLPEALDLIGRLISDNPDNRELADLNLRVRQEKNRIENTTTVQTAVREAEMLLRDGKADAAINVLEAASRTAGSERELKELLKKAEDARQAGHDRQYIEAELKHAKVFEERNDVATSLKIIEGALRQFPKSAELLAARERFSAGRQSPREAVVSPKTPDDATTLFAPAALDVRPPEEIAPANDLAPAKDPAPANDLKKKTEDLQPAPQLGAGPLPQPAVNPVAKSNWRTYGIVAAVLAMVSVGLMFWMRPSAIAVSPERLSFVYQPGASPVTQTITVTGSSDAAPPQANAAWLAVTPGPESSGKTEFKVRVRPAKLSPGAYTGLLTFAQNRQVTVNLTVAQSRALIPSGDTVQPASLLFQYSPAGVQPQKIVVSGVTPITNPQPSERWVSVTRHDLGAGKAEFLVQVAGNGLAPGLHTAFLAFSKDKKVPVELMIPGGSTTAVSPSFLKFPDGGVQQKVTFMGSGEVPDPTPSEPWLTVTRSSVSPGKVEFLVTTSTGDLDPGKYDAYLSFAADKKVRVELLVPEDLTTLQVKPDSLSFTSGGPPQTVVVTASDDIPNPTVTDRWIKFTRRDSGAGYAEFDVQANPAGLVPGPHVGYLNFTPVRNVRIVLMVTPGKAPRP